MRIAISNRYWATAGGGEAYAAAIARALSERGTVDLLAPGGVDLTDVGRRLQLPLDGFGSRVVDFVDVAGLRRVVSEYDLFVNATWDDDLVPTAARNVLVVHFPPPPPDRAHSWSVTARRLVRRAATGDAHPLLLEGFHPLEHADRAFRWTDGDGVVELGGGQGRRRVEVVFGSANPVPVEVEVEAAGRRAGTTIRPGSGDTTLTVELDGGTGDGGDGAAGTIHIRSDTFSPRDAIGSDDDRRLGVQLFDVRVLDGARSRLARRGVGSCLATHRAPVYRSYDHVLVDSEFARTWMRRWWAQDAAVVHPAVSPRARLRKERLIVAVGRFFPPERGHSKAQLEMVHAFADLRTRCPAAHDWTLHLVGGCQEADRHYLDRVRSAAEGLPIRFHVDAPGREVSDLYGRASILWHATGLGQPADAPERHEHFGMSVVEGMSAGAVPVVYWRGGPAATVRRDVDGVHFRTSDELAGATARLVEDGELRARLAARARVRAAAFSFDALRRAVLAAVPV